MGQPRTSQQNQMITVQYVIRISGAITTSY
jgi:hypothetical protein